MRAYSSKRPPKTLVIAPDIPANEVMRLCAHVDEAVTDPDYSILISYGSTREDWTEKKKLPRKKRPAV